MKLKEYKDAKGNPVGKTSSSAVSSTGNTSSGYKERFEKLLDYHIAHKDKDVVKILQKDIQPWVFHYSEQHKGEFEGGYKKDVIASFNKDGAWNFMIFMDSKQIKEKHGIGWDNFVWDISFYLNLPEVTTDPEYQDLLESAGSIADDFKLYENLWD